VAPVWFYPISRVVKMNLSTEAGGQWGLAVAREDRGSGVFTQHTHNELLSSDFLSMTCKALAYLHSRCAPAHHRHHLGRVALSLVYFDAYTFKSFGSGQVAG